MCIYTLVTDLFPLHEITAWNKSFFCCKPYFTLLCRYHVERGLVIFLGHCELLSVFLRQLNHLFRNVIHSAIPVLNMCKFCRYIQQKEHLLMYLQECFKTCLYPQPEPSALYLLCLMYLSEHLTLFQ